MDVLNLIKSQIDEALKLDSSLVGLNSVLTHIERAEFLLNKATELADEHLFTDVVYRTNHSFEGILQEAYKVLTRVKSASMTPYEIEKRFLEKKLLNERVVELLKKYRQEWRNPSTHDYNLFFGYGEAFLAIMSISSFVHVFMNQILEKLYYEREKDSIEGDLPTIRKRIEDDYENLPLIDEVRTILVSFAKRNHSRSMDEIRFSRFEAEMIGTLTAYIESIDERMKVHAEPLVVSGSRKLRPDLIIEREKERLLVEIKITPRNRPSKSRLMYEDQLLSYLIHTNIQQGLLVELPNEMHETDEYDVLTKELQVGDNLLTVMSLSLMSDKAK